MISDSTTLHSCTQGGTAQWMSPELLNPEIQDRRQTKSSDCYALGMVIYEVLSGHVPFPRCNNYVVAIKVLRGERPERPQGMEWNWFMGAGKVWEVLGRCWVPQPGDRPGIEDVLQCLKEVSESWMPPSPRLLEVPPIAGSLSRGFYDTVATESTDWSEETTSQVASSRPPEELDQDGSIGIVSEVRWMNPHNEFCRQLDVPLGSTQPP